MNKKALLEIVNNAETPLYMYDGESIFKTALKFRAVFRGCTAYYSVKANPHPSVCALLAMMGFEAEVVTKGEIDVAIRAGFDPSRMLYAGPGKTKAQVEFAVDSGIRIMTAESMHQIELMEEAAGRRHCAIAILLRINESALRNEHCESMMGAGSQFGMDVDAWTAQRTKIKTLKHTRIAGTQYYSASQVLDPQLLPRSVRHQIKTTKVLMAILSSRLQAIDIGGGFGIPYVKGQSGLNLEACGKAVRREISKVLLPDVQVIVESGRYLVGPAGLFLTRIIDVKTNAGRLYAICDGGMAGFTRPMLVRSTHPIELLKMGRASEERVDCTICGFSCSSLDRFGTFNVPRPEIGDVVVVKNAGAYGHSMSIHSFHSTDAPRQIYIPPVRRETSGLMSRK